MRRLETRVGEVQQEGQQLYQQQQRHLQNANLSTCKTFASTLNRISELNAQNSRIEAELNWGFELIRELRRRQHYHETAVREMSSEMVQTWIELRALQTRLSRLHFGRGRGRGRGYGV